MDPLGKVDTFAHLTDRERDFWSKDKGGTIDDKLKYLEDIEVTTAVEIRLVGFEGDGNQGVFLGENDFARLLDTVKSTFQAHVINAPNGRHSLAVSTKFFYRVSKAPRSLVGEVQQKVQELISNARDVGDDPSDHIPIAADEIDAIIARDFKTSELSSFIVYVLNPHPPAGPEHNRKPMYAYKYRSGLGGEGFAGCLGPLLAGQQRYVWVDLTSGPLRYGPRTIGKGVVGRHTLPRVTEYTKDTRKSLLSADITALVRSAAQHLAAPSMAFFPVRYWEETEVRVVRIRDGMGGAKMETRGFDTRAIEKELQGLRLRGQSVSIKVTDVIFGDCDLCVAAFTRALKAHATGGHARHSYAPAVHEHLDAAELHYWLNKYEGGLLEEAGLGGDVAAARADARGRVGGRRVLLVYVFDMPQADTLLLLDRHHQAMAFSDMVVAVRTRAGESFADFMCEGGMPPLDPSDITRPVAAALLQTGWGVAPTEDSWNPATNATDKSYLWSVGSTPFGALSFGGTSFAQREAAMRNILISHMNVTVTEAARLLRTVARFVPEGSSEALLPALKSDHYVAHWNVLRYKLERAASYLALGKFDVSLYYVRACDHELAALQRIVQGAGASITTSLQCFQEAPFPWGSYLGLLGLAVGGSWVWKRRAGLSKNKAL